MNEPQTHLVIVTEDDFGCVVAPASVLARRGDQIVFVNLTGSSASVEFEGATPMSPSVGEVKPGEQNAVTRVVADDAAGSYPYRVFCQSRQQFAQASIPRIIIIPAIP